MKSARVGKVDLLKVPNSKISGPTCLPYGFSRAVKNCSSVRGSRKCSFASPARLPYRACFGQVSTVMSSGTLKPKMKFCGVASNSFAQYCSLGNW